MAFSNTRNAKKSLVPNYCEIPDCEFTALITRHRIKPGRKGGKYVPGNVIGLCPNCHQLAEIGYFSQYELFMIVQQRLKEDSQMAELKVCNKCGLLKSFSEFNKNPQTPDGYRYECRDCRAALRKEKYEGDPEKNRESIYAWRIENPDKVKLYTRTHQLKKRYGISLIDYDQLLKEQSGHCAICPVIHTDELPLHVDHDHETGQVRGLLCRSCNHGVGNFKDDPVLLEKAIDYVSRAREVLAV